MIRSMTGYGRGEHTINGRKFVVEIKSVNGRYNDITIKMPKFLLSLEDKVKKILTNSISRGKTDVYITFESNDNNDTLLKLDKNLAISYFNQLKELREVIGINDEISLLQVANYPDVIKIDKNFDSIDNLEEFWDVLEIAVNYSLSSFIKMRETEGLQLKTDIIEKIKTIKLDVKEIEKMAPLVAIEFSKKIKLKMEDLLKEIEIDQNRVLTEVALFADKACIDEELTRLNSHIMQIEKIIIENEPIGRKLDFILQEMNREVNTIGSKSNDLNITNIVVNLKSSLEKVREQIQNIE